MGYEGDKFSKLDATKMCLLQYIGKTLEMHGIHVETQNGKTLYNVEKVHFNFSMI